MTGQWGAVTDDLAPAGMSTSSVAAAPAAFASSRPLRESTCRSSSSHHTAHDAADYSTCVRTVSERRAALHIRPTDDTSHQTLTSTIHTDTQTHNDRKHTTVTHAWLHIPDYNDFHSMLILQQNLGQLVAPNSSCSIYPQRFSSGTSGGKWNRRLYDPNVIPATHSTNRPSV